MLVSPPVILPEQLALLYKYKAPLLVSCFPELTTILPELFIVLLKVKFCDTFSVPPSVINPLKPMLLTTALFSVPFMIRVPVPVTTVSKVAVAPLEI